MPVSPTVFHPAATFSEALQRAAEMWGVTDHYWNIRGERVDIPQSTQAAVLRSMGVPTDSLEQLNAAIERRHWEEWARPVPETVVLSQSSAMVDLRLPEALENATLTATLIYEDSARAHFELPLSELPVHASVRLRGQRFVRKRVLLPGPLPLGYHRMTLAVTGIEAVDTALIVAPDRAYLPPVLEGGARVAGIAVSLYGLRSERNWGCGDFTDLRALADWAALEARVDFIALNPLHAIANRAPFNTSPYLPESTYYRNLLYLDVEAIPDFAQSPMARRLLSGSLVQRELRELRESSLVEYERVQSLKLPFLRLLFRRFLREEWRCGTARARQFRDYVEAEGELLDRYATYCALNEWIHRRNPSVWIWPDWPAPYQDPDSEATRQFAREHWRRVLFFKYVQWNVDQQIAAAQAHARRAGLLIGLYHDLALATDRCGSDLWAYRRYYVAGCRVGSPPDDFAPDGQDWSFPPPDKEYHRQTGYALFREAIRRNCRHGGALRIDHVMRLFRLFWIPDGQPARDGTYVRDYPEDLLRVLALESVRQQVLIVGEDLGTVVDSIRDALSRFGILSYRLLYFERDSDGGFRRPADYPKQALVSSTTHDLPTLAGFWTGRDIEARRAAGLLSDDAYVAQLAERSNAKQKMLDAMFALKLLPDWCPRSAADMPEMTGELHNAIIGFLASTPCALLVLNQEDLTKETEQQNLPGSTSEYPNWRRKMRYSLEQLRTEKAPRDFTTMFRNWLARTGRCHR